MTYGGFYWREGISSTSGPPGGAKTTFWTTNGQLGEVLMLGNMFAFDLDPQGGHEMLKIPSRQ